MFMQLLSLLLFWHNCCLSVCNNISEVSMIMNSIVSNNYNKNIRPNYDNGPVDINVTVYIKDISSVSETDMDFTSEIFLRQGWNDERLAFNSTDGKALSFGTEFAKRIWLPDTFILNGKQTITHQSTNLETNSFVKVKPNGDVKYSIRLTVVAICQMNLQYFPMDTQMCRLEIESYGYDSTEVNYNWFELKEEWGQFPKNVSLSNFKILGFLMGKEYFQSAKTFGEFNLLVYGIVFTRYMGYYLNQVYVPAIMIVVISWVPFWLDRDDNNARVGIGVTTVLTMTTLVTNTNASMPKISYMKSLDIYLSVCFAMVFAALLQYASVGYTTSQFCKKVSDFDKKKSKNVLTKYGGHIPRLLDVYARLLFPVTFIVFNLIYWITDLTLSRVTFDGLITI